METKRNFTPDPTDYNTPIYAHAGALSITGDRITSTIKNDPASSQTQSLQSSSSQVCHSIY